ncbi:hypothetical protein TheveDRAFT_1503 [Thermanaerovibrio velox DSM 12556]|uniref:Kynureninase n=1 Tax=Thermanaerovibrio velox DSM 12556 TaxID=926567 RepID=H0UPR2_9BACT|nr:hypothetical protein [Thermanaerovibrio velox]EHM10621.1 hypothetical protein TheveDRAFT_1503 [Thermanaerovibrio velox DSM 12556]
MMRLEDMVDRARTMDMEDPLKVFRELFLIPQDVIYMDGNSLGLPPRESVEGVMRVLKEWENLGVDGWLKGEIPWFTMPEEMGRRMAP